MARKKNKQTNGACPTANHQVPGNSKKNIAVERQQTTCSVYLQKVKFRNRNRSKYIELLCQYYYDGVDGIENYLKEKTNKIADLKEIELPVRLSRQEKEGWKLCDKKKRLYYRPIPSYEELSKSPSNEASSEEGQWIQDFDFILQYLRALEGGDDYKKKDTQPEQKDNSEKEITSGSQEQMMEGTDVPQSVDVTEETHAASSPEMASAHSNDTWVEDFDRDASSPDIASVHSGENPSLEPVQPLLPVGEQEENDSQKLHDVVTKVEQLQKNTKELLKRFGEQEEKIEAQEKNKQQKENEEKEYKEKFKNLEEEYNKLKGSLKECEGERDNYKTNLENAQKRHKQYVDCLECYDDNVKKWAKNAHLMFECLERMEQGADQLYQQQKNAPPNDMDDMNHYMLRIQSKYAEARNSISNLSQIRQELNNLALLGMLPKQGILYQRLKEPSNPLKQEKELRFYIHKTIVGPLMGAAIIRCDEYAFFLPHFVKNIPHEMCKFFADLSVSIQNLMKILNYEVEYAAPFRKIEEFNNVKNVEKAPSQLNEQPSGTIFEVKKMAINYGNHKEETEVSAFV